ncbi:UrcA family protein [Sphingomicrobium sediminis]|uniref:UrcA family protein n=1 Tax=Sphingomicrobium sediminis TaxID=2950949 RepID=A0A9X2J1Y0_9SPHN|nr:UrcA family protein [Sphingomicrobium sediminis]MCM8557214.1 UrcA family protein [Sphingomicrobium sediminis]
MLKMKMMMTALTAASLAATPAMAEPVQVTVSTEGLDLASVEGREALEDRAKKAARNACGSRSAVVLGSGKDVKECRSGVVTKVMDVAMANFEHEGRSYAYATSTADNGDTVYEGEREDGVRFRLSVDEDGVVKGKVGDKKVRYRAPRN